MKNLMIWVHPTKDFDQESSVLIKIQIDNCLELGWKKEDIILITNFPYEREGIVASIVPDETFYQVFRKATKPVVIDYLFKSGFIKDDLYWLHDLEAFQNYPFTEEELGLENAELGLTDYGRHDQWNGGSMFFKKGSADFFHILKNLMYGERVWWKSEEDLMVKMINENVNNLRKRVKRLNISYNFGIKQMKLCYEKAIKPIRVLHFHPERIYRTWGRAFNIVCGHNELGFPIMEPRLINLFKKYGITRTN